MNKFKSEKLKPGREEHYNLEYSTALSLSRSRYVLYLPCPLLNFAESNITVAKHAVTKRGCESLLLEDKQDNT
jgi:hypothetical protein